MADTGRPFPSLRPPRAVAVSRRQVVAALALLAAAPGLAAAQAAAPLPAPSTLLVAGPQGGRLDRWGQVLAELMLPALDPGALVERQAAGGEDGVTGANQFATRVAPDGGTLLLVPGEAALAWMVGDRRAQFDAGTWLAVMTATAPAAIVCRTPPQELRRGARLRVAMAGPVGHDLAALLGLELAGLAPEPVFGIADAAGARQALAARTVDAALLRGRDLAGQLTAAAAVGATPLCALGAADRDGRDPALADLPSVAELARALTGAAPSGLLHTAWRGVATAVQTEFALVLAHLTPAAQVSRWRQVAHQAAEAPGLREEATGFRLGVAADAAALVQALTPEAAAMTALREWLARRLQWTG